METEKIQRPEKEIRDKQREEDGMERRHGETDDEEVERPSGRMGRWVMPQRFFPYLEGEFSKEARDINPMVRVC
jgi:hypothetical protein